MNENFDELGHVEQTGSAEGKITIGNIAFSVIPTFLPKGVEISKVLTEDDVRRIVREEIAKFLSEMTK